MCISVFGKRLCRKSNNVVVFPFAFHIVVQQPFKPLWSRLLLYDLEPSQESFALRFKSLRGVDQKHPESCEMWCWRRKEKISWTDHVRNEDVLLRVKEQRNILHEIRKWKTSWIGHILRRNCLLQRVTEGKIQGG